MNIREATDQIEGAVRAYLSRDEHGIYRIPSRMQRPIIMMGPPGVGKTAIAAQIADELGINFVSYSITHHTRQSALGLPYIATAEFGGREYRVSRYTMSEIIAAVWDTIEATGVREGILFLDEVNCASETLMPSMLQFLQYKTFGQHRLPEGWVIVCAGNPPEYNRAAREFDPAMMDRLKRIDVEPDLDVWQDYAAA
ncbi:MAG: MoxR family ATPase, partial [Olegusella sp.]|nr:MoxR family ATPase [Olegusella sp.]